MVDQLQRYRHVVVIAFGVLLNAHAAAKLMNPAARLHTWEYIAATFFLLLTGYSFADMAAPDDPDTA